MDQLDEAAAAATAVAEAEGFSGVVRVDVGGHTWAQAFGWADRRHDVPATTDTRFAIASGTKGLTALVVASLVEDGTLSWSTEVRSLLGADLPLVHDDVTVEHLLAHRSGIGDYFDESADGAITDHVMTIPVHRLDCAEAYLEVLDGYPQVAPPGATFAYCNGGYVILALVAERAAGVPFAELVDVRVVRPAGLRATDFPRSDALPADVATGYLHREGPQTNVLHLPVVGVGDGGAVTTADDVHRLWSALFAGRIVSPGTVSAMVTPHPGSEHGPHRYGLGFWVRAVDGAVQLEGYDAGVSFRSVHHPGAGWTQTTISNWSDGAWPVARALSDAL